MKTLAIVIGNNDYHEDALLKNAVNDATAIYATFERLGFDVKFFKNMRRDEIPTILSYLRSNINNYDATIFYFAGHGFEVDGENYLTSIDCQIPPADKYVAGLDSIKLSDVLDIYSGYPDKVNLMIIDACRKTFDRGGSLGFSSIQSPRGTLIAFSTSPNQGAKDGGYNDHSYYTGVLLDFLGRERLSVEELFKKVRKTVYSLTGGKQTTWEHTSLISDYYFNTGQLVFSLNIPYNEAVVTDIKFSEDSDFGKIIKKFKSYNFTTQNNALEEVLRISPQTLDKNQKFVLGRNILQAANGGAWDCIAFIEELNTNLSAYQEKNGDNHLLNGILFEVYFDSNGNYRKDKKNRLLQEIFKVRKKEELKNSFDFIKNLLIEQQDNKIYLPDTKDVIYDIDIVASNKITKTEWSTETRQMISKISLNNIDITEAISRYNLYRGNEEALIEYLSDYLCIPKELIKINCLIKLEKIYFDRKTQVTW